MPEKNSKAAAQDNLGQSGTDSFPTYQDKAGLTAADAGKGKPADEVEEAPAKVELNHGEKSPQQQAEEDEMKKNPPSPTPVQMLPENQDETVK